MVTSTKETGVKAPTLTVFNTLIPQACSGSSRRLSFLPGYSEEDVLLHVDQDRYLGTSNGGGPLITDPTQAILVVEFLGSQWGYFFARCAGTSFDRKHSFDVYGRPYTMG